MENLTISDGVIEQIISVAGKLEIIFKDWKENTWRLTVDEIVAFESIGAEGTEIGELMVEDHNEYKNRIINMLPEESDINMSAFVFKSAWTGLSVLQVVGMNFKAQRI